MRFTFTLTLIVLCVFALPAFVQADSLLNIREAEYTVSLDKEQGSLMVLRVKPSSPDAELKDLRPELISLTDPVRLVLDVYGIRSMKNIKREINKDAVKSLRIGVHPDKLRVVVDLEGSSVPQFDVLPPATPGEVIVAFQPLRPSIPEPAEVPEIAVPDSQASKADALVSQAPKTTETVKEEVGQGAPAPVSNSLDELAAKEDTIENETVAPLAEEEPASETIGSLQEETSSDPVSEIQQQELEAYQPTTVTPEPDRLNGLYFTKEEDSGSPALRLETSNFKGNFALNRSDKNRYELKINNILLGGDHLLLPQFAPDTYTGLEAAVARQRDDSVVVTIYVGDDVKLQPYTKDNELWLRVEN